MHRWVLQRVKIGTRLTLLLEVITLSPSFIVFYVWGRFKDYGTVEEKFDQAGNFA